MTVELTGDGVKNLSLHGLSFVHVLVEFGVELLGCLLDLLFASSTSSSTASTATATAYSRLLLLVAVLDSVQEGLSRLVGSS